MVTYQYYDTYLSSTVTYHYIEEPYDDSLNKENNSTNNLNEASRLFTNEGTHLFLEDGFSEFNFFLINQLIFFFL